MHKKLLGFASMVAILAMSAVPAMAQAATYTAPTRDSVFTSVTGPDGFGGIADLSSAIAVAVLVGVALVALVKKGPKFIKWGVSKLT